MARVAHSISIVQGRSEDGEARFRPRCSCGWSAPRSAGVHASELADELAAAHLQLGAVVGAHVTGVDEVWIGLVELAARPASELFGEDGGAMTTVLASASRLLDFANTIEAFYDAQGVDVVEFADIERVHEREARVGLSDETRVLADVAGASRAVQTDAYYVFPRDDDPGASIRVGNQAGVDEVVEKVERFMRGWLAGALEQYPAGLEIRDIGIAIENREPGDTPFAVGYAASASELSEQADLFRAAVRLAEEQDEDPAV